jgi:hypothetical protein
MFSKLIHWSNHGHGLSANTRKVHATGDNSSVSQRVDANRSPLKLKRLLCLYLRSISVLSLDNIHQTRQILKSMFVSAALAVSIDLCAPRVNA